MVQVIARLKHARLSPQKCRLVCDVIRGMPVDKALDTLRFNSKKAAGIVKKVLESAIANAEHNEGADIDELRVSTIYANEGPSFRRVQARAKGRATRLTKPTCHITVVVSDEVRS